MLRPALSRDDLLGALKAAAEPTRLRILALVGRGELTVKDFTRILGQSQPRISRHLRLLVEAGLLERHAEGSWAYYRPADRSGGSALVQTLLAALDGDAPALARDRDRLAAVRRERAEIAQAYFARSAADWDKLRALHVDEAEVEAAMRVAVGRRPFQALLDLGTGTGWLLVLFQDLYARGVGIDLSHDMLAVARANLAAAGVTHAQVRHGDLDGLAMPRDSFDLVTLHQVLHFLDEPGRAIAEAARVLRPGGRLLVVDFAPHGHEELLERHAHRRLGISHDQMASWLAEAGLEPEMMRDLAPDADGKLTVTLWLARDPRLLVATPHLEGAAA